MASVTAKLKTWLEANWQKMKLDYKLGGAFARWWEDYSFACIKSSSVVVLPPRMASTTPQAIKAKPGMK